MACCAPPSETVPADLLATQTRAVVEAAHADRKTTGRPGLLTDDSRVRALLVALAAGRSVLRASKDAGFSEPGVRMWLRLGAAPGATGPTAALVSAVAALRASSAAAVAVDNTVHVQPAEVVVAAPPPSTVANVVAVEVAAAARQREILQLSSQLRMLIDAHGLTDAALHVRNRLDRLLQLEAPANETRADRERRFYRWRVLTCRPGLNECEYELARDRGFQVEGFAAR